MHLITILKEHLQNQVTDQLIDEVVYGWPQQFNNIAGRCKTPVGYLVTPTKWKLDCNAVAARELGTFTIYFLIPQLELDFDADDNEQLIDLMIDVAVDFVGRLKLDKRVHIENIEVEGRSMYDANNKNLTGVCLTLKLLENGGRCLPTKNTCL